MTIVKGGVYPWNKLLPDWDSSWEIINFEAFVALNMFVRDHEFGHDLKAPIDGMVYNEHGIVLDVIEGGYLVEIYITERIDGFNRSRTRRYEVTDKLNNGIPVVETAEYRSTKGLIAIEAIPLEVIPTMKQLDDEVYQNYKRKLDTLKT